MAEGVVAQVLKVPGLLQYASHLTYPAVFSKFGSTGNIMRRLTTALPVLLFAAAVSRADIQYNVDRTIGSTTAVGFIETNGDTGILLQPDIIDWDLTLTDGAFTWDLLGPRSGNNSVVYLRGFDLRATPTELLFNFGHNGTFLVQTNLFAGSTYYCDSTFDIAGACVPGESIVPGTFPGPGFANAPRSGIEVIGTTSSVPEPGYLPAVGLLLGVTMGMARRRRGRA